MLSEFRNIIRDMRTLGSGTLRRYLPRTAGSKVFRLTTDDYGDVYLRHETLDFELARSVLGNECYDVDWPAPALMRLETRYQAILKKGLKPVIVNAGGYIGLSALWFARRWPEAIVVSIEPDHGNLEILRRNVGHLERHRILEAALGSAPGYVDTSTGEDGCAIRTMRSANGIKIVTVDEAVGTVQNAASFICNIDIEGFEADLFAENTDWIDDFALVIIEPHDWRDPGSMSSASFQRAMADRNFELYLHGSAIHYLHA